MQYFQNIDIRKDIQKGYHRIEVEKQIFSKKVAIITSRLESSRIIDNQIKECQTMLEFLTEEEIALQIKTTDENLSEPRRILKDIEGIERSPGLNSS